MQRISITALEARWQEIIKAMPELKRAEFEDLGPEILAEVREEIGGSGKVQDWQEYQVGSRGGYVAVRPEARTWTDGSGRYAVGYVTNAINSGHGGRKEAVFDKVGHRKIVKTGFVPGKHFYEHAAQRSEALIRKAVGRLEARMKELAEQ